MSKKKLTPLMQQFWQVKQAHPDKILLFRMGDFFEMFYDDAETAAPILGIALTQRNKKAEDSTPMCGVPHHSIAGPINKLLESGHKVAICDQIEDPKEAKGIVKRAVTRILTPGMVYDADQLQGDQPNYLCAFDSNRVAFFETSTYESFFYEEISQKQVWELIKVLAPVEVVLADGQKLLDHFSMHTSHFNGAESACERLIGYVETLQLKRPQIEFEKRQLLNVMPLSETVLRHLEVFKTNSGEKKGSLFEALKKTKTAPGARLLKRWLCFPLVDSAQIFARQERIEQLAKNTQLLDEVQTELASLGDIERRINKIETSQQCARDLQVLSDNLQHGLKVSDLFGQLTESDMQRVPAIFQVIAKIQETLAEELPQQLKDGGFIRKGFNAELDKYIDLSENANERLREMEAKEKETTGIPSLKIRYNNVFGYYIEVTNAHKNKVPEHYLRKQTLTNAERYCTDALQELEREVLTAKTKRVDLEKALLENLREFVLGEKSTLLYFASKWASIDVLAGFAQLALENNYVRPVFADEILLKHSRHPVIERTTDFTPNTIDLRRGQCILLTGPNMAGKSTIMRQLAVTAMMAQMGCFVPASEAQLPIFDQIYTRIGASDNLTSGLSTFMVEMVETSHIIENTTSQSLVILDEIGRGTSTFDGMSLAQSLLEHLVTEAKSFIMFATHYHELTTLADSLTQIRNAHMAVADDGGKFEFLHTLKEGPANKSYGIHVAQLAGLPKSITKRAKQLLNSHERTSHSATAQFSLLDQVDFEEDAADVWGEKIKELTLGELTPVQLMLKVAEWQDELR